MGFQIGNSRLCDHLSSNLVSSFSVCVFLWVRRDVNQLAHALAKVAPSLPQSFACFRNSLPPLAITLFVVMCLSFNKISKKKKKKIM
jgi:hypothetical protein